ncbi:MAG: hypothetical protein HW416_2521 [Chloroflexi bacterium]|nr:hypothetical protein [Chloroflexota bacterium]
MFSKTGPFIPCKRLALLLVALTILGLFTPASAQPQPTEIVFGALLDLTGDWSALGISSKAVLEIATKEINQELASSGWTAQSLRRSCGRSRLRAFESSSAPRQALRFGPSNPSQTPTESS